MYGICIFLKSIISNSTMLSSLFKGASSNEKDEIIKKAIQDRNDFIGKTKGVPTAKEVKKHFGNQKNFEIITKHIKHKNYVLSCDYLYTQKLLGDIDNVCVFLYNQHKGNELEIKDGQMTSDMTSTWLTLCRELLKVLYHFNQCIESRVNKQNEIKTRNNYLDLLSTIEENHLYIIKLFADDLFESLKVVKTVIYDVYMALETIDPKYIYNVFGIMSTFIEFVTESVQSLKNSMQLTDAEIPIEEINVKEMEYNVSKHTEYINSQGKGNYPMQSEQSTPITHTQSKVSKKEKPGKKGKEKKEDILSVLESFQETGDTIPLQSSLTSKTTGVEDPTQRYREFIENNMEKINNEKDKNLLVMLEPYIKNIKDVQEYIFLIEKKNISIYNDMKKNDFDTSENINLYSQVIRYKIRLFIGYLMNLSYLGRKITQGYIISDDDSGDNIFASVAQRIQMSNMHFKVISKFIKKKDQQGFTNTCKEILSYSKANMELLNKRLSSGFSKKSKPILISGEDLNLDETIDYWTPSKRYIIPTLSINATKIPISPSKSGTSLIPPVLTTHAPVASTSKSKRAKKLELS